MMSTLTLEDERTLDQAARGLLFKKYYFRIR